MEYIEKTNHMLDYLKSINAIKILGGNIDLFVKLITYIKKCFDALNADIEIVTQDNILNDINRNNQILDSIFTNQPFTPDFSMFVNDYCLLVSNFNNNTLKNEQVNGKLSTISRMYDMCLTTADLINVTRNQISQLRRYEQFALPSISLSKHYLEAIEGNLTDGKKEEEK